MNVSGGGRFFIIFVAQRLKLWNWFVERRYIIHSCIPYYLKMLSAKYVCSISISDVTVTAYANMLVVYRPPPNKRQDRRLYISSEFADIRGIYATLSDELVGDILFDNITNIHTSPSLISD